MTDKEQIEEMARIIALDGCGNCNNCKEKGGYGCYFNVYKGNAESIYDAGYRKVLLKTENGYMVDCPKYAPWELIKGYTEREVEKARKETAKEFAKELLKTTDLFIDITDIVNYILKVRFGIEVEE